MRRLLVLLVIVSCSTAVLAHAQDWPQFRGPAGQGHAAVSKLPAEWSEDKNVIWKTPVPGIGWSSPVLAGGRIWLTTATGDADVSLRAMAFDVASGKPVVDTEVFRLRRARDINPKNSYASPTPVIDGDRVYVHFGADGTAALDSSGAVVWSTRLPYESQHGAGGSPVVYNDVLILNCDGHDQAFVVALDKRTGRVKWRTNRRQPADQAYTTPLVIKVGNQDQVVSVGAFRTTAYDPDSGKEIWRVSYGDGFSNVPRPVYGHGLVFIATGFQQPAILAVRADGKGDVTQTHVAWTLQRGAPYTPSPLLVGDELYVVTDGGIASCLNARTGAVHWQMRLGGTYSASPVFADGRIYFAGEHGGVTAITPGTQFRRVGNSMLEGSILASLAVSVESIFIRTDSHLYRISDQPR